MYLTTSLNRVPTIQRDGLGWGPWSIKAGIDHVRPSSDIVARMLAIRIHLDECGADNGPASDSRFTQAWFFVRQADTGMAERRGSDVYSQPG
jgi:hypothetical protein